LLFFPFKGGPVFNLIARGYVYLPLVILVLIMAIGFINSTMSSLVGREKLNPVKKNSGIALVLLLTVHWGFTSEIFKSEIVLHATLDDDLFHENLVLRKNGTCLVETAGWLGYNKLDRSTYTLKGDTVYLGFSGDAIPSFGNILLIDTTHRAVYFRKDSTGQFSKALEWLNFLQIHAYQSNLWENE
jgi:hypothetical protein